MLWWSWGAILRALEDEAREDLGEGSVLELGGQIVLEQQMCLGSFPTLVPESGNQFDFLHSLGMEK